MSVTVSVFLDLKNFSEFYILGLLSILFCMWPQKAFLILLLVVLAVTMSFTSGSSSVNFFKLLLESIILHFALDNTSWSTACSGTLSVP